MAACDSSLPKHKGLSQVEKFMLSYWFKIRPFKGLSQAEKVMLLVIGSKLDTFIQKKMASTCSILIVLYQCSISWGLDIVYNTVMEIAASPVINKKS